MGLFDDPIGYLFGEEDKEVVMDRRLPREERGEKWWQTWDRIFGQGGPADPYDIYGKATELLRQEPVKINIGGQTISVYPQSRQRQATGLLSALDLWREGGLTLESGRMGQPYYSEGGDGLLGTLIGGVASGFGGGLSELAFNKPTTTKTP